MSSDELDALLLFRFQSAKETTQGLGQVAVERERESQAVGPAGLSLGEPEDVSHIYQSI